MATAADGIGCGVVDRGIDYSRVVVSLLQRSRQRPGRRRSRVPVSIRAVKHCDFGDGLFHPVVVRDQSRGDYRRRRTPAAPVGRSSSPIKLTHPEVHRRQRRRMPVVFGSGFGRSGAVHGSLATHFFILGFPTIQRAPTRSDAGSQTAKRLHSLAILVPKPRRQSPALVFL